MRFLVEVRTPVEVGNAGMKDGTLPGQIQQYLNEVKPEVVYFSAAHGQRTIYLVADSGEVWSPDERGESCF